MTITRRRSATTLPPNPTPATDQCRCRTMIAGQLQPGGRPVLIATFRDQHLAELELRHWGGRDGCRTPNEHLDPISWQTAGGIR